MKSRKIKITIIILFLNLFLIPLVLGATINNQNSGFVQGDFFYGTDIFLEKIRYLFIFNLEKEIEYSMKKSDERLAEISSLINNRNRFQNKILMCYKSNEKIINKKDLEKFINKKAMVGECEFAININFKEAELISDEESQERIINHLIKETEFRRIYYLNKANTKMLNLKVNDIEKINNFNKQLEDTNLVIDNLKKESPESIIETLEIIKINNIRYQNRIEQVIKNTKNENNKNTKIKEIIEPKLLRDIKNLS